MVRTTKTWEHLKGVNHFWQCVDAILESVDLLSKCKMSGKSGNLLEKEWRELNAGQSVLEWNIFTLKWVWKLFFNLKRVEDCHQKSPFTPFRVLLHSKTYCPAFNSYKEWKSTLLHLESSWNIFGNKLLKRQLLSYLPNIAALIQQQKVQ